MRMATDWWLPKPRESRKKQPFGVHPAFKTSGLSASAIASFPMRRFEGGDVSRAAFSNVPRNTHSKIVRRLWHERQVGHEDGLQ